MAKPEYSDGYIAMFMDAMPANLEFELNDLRIIEMLPRHCGFEVNMTDAGMEMLGLEPPLEPSTTLAAIDQAMEQIRNGETLDCSETFSAATLGILWAWQLVGGENWKWCAVSQEWWETLAVCDKDEQIAILPVQYFRRLAGETGLIGESKEAIETRSPLELFEAIRSGNYPDATGKTLKCIF